jgi:hypothetical protein
VVEIKGTWLAILHKKNFAQKTLYFSKEEKHLDNNNNNNNEQRRK